jgi:hypothetical protein
LRLLLRRLQDNFVVGELEVPVDEVHVESVLGHGRAAASEQREVCRWALQAGGTKPAFGDLLQYGTGTSSLPSEHAATPCAPRGASTAPHHNHAQAWLLTAHVQIT